MDENESVNDEKVWISFFRRHWKMVLIFVIGAIIAAVGAVYVLLWHVHEAQITGLVPGTLDLWSMAHFISFVLYLILWELLFVGIPVLIAIGAIIFLWWKKLPEDERQEYKDAKLFSGNRSKTSDGGGIISFLAFIVFLVKISYDGNWSTPVAQWEFNYLVYSYLWSLLIVLVIIGVPMLLGGIWWIRHEMNKST
jgi:hypothetical protein